MLFELFLLMALGNVTMKAGMVYWALLDAHGRYRLATAVAIACSMCITVPLAATLAWMRIDLQGLVFLVVMGYSVAATLLSTLLLMSDWDQLSKEVTEGFSPNLRHHWSWDDDSMWWIWPTLRDHGYFSREL